MKNNVTAGQKEGTSFCSMQKESKKLPIVSNTNTHTHTGFEVLLLVFWDMMLCGLVDIYQSLKECTCCCLPGIISKPKFLTHQ
jgi:hypothetical protein